MEQITIANNNKQAATYGENSIHQRFINASTNIIKDDLDPFSIASAMYYCFTGEKYDFTRTKAFGAPEPYKASTPATREDVKERLCEKIMFELAKGVDVLECFTTFVRNIVNRQVKPETDAFNIINITTEADRYQLAEEIITKTANELITRQVEQTFERNDALTPQLPSPIAKITIMNYHANKEMMTPVHTAFVEAAKTTVINVYAKQLEHDPDSRSDDDGFTLPPQPKNIYSIYQLTWVDSPTVVIRNEPKLMQAVRQHNPLTVLNKYPTAEALGIYQTAYDLWNRRFHIESALLIQHIESTFRINDVEHYKIRLPYDLDSSPAPITPQPAQVKSNIYKTTVIEVNDMYTWNFRVYILGVTISLIIIALIVVCYRKAVKQNEAFTVAKSPPTMQDGHTLLTSLSSHNRHG